MSPLSVPKVSGKPCVAKMLLSISMVTEALIFDICASTHFEGESTRARSMPYKQTSKIQVETGPRMARSLPWVEQSRCWHLSVPLKLWTSLPFLLRCSPSQTTKQMNWQGSSSWTPRSGLHAAHPLLVHTLVEEQSPWIPAGYSHSEHLAPTDTWHNAWAPPDQPQGCWPALHLPSLNLR